MLSKITLAFIFILLYFLLSYRITGVPMGLTVDEHAFGWNAALLSKTGYDENGTHMPLFVNSISKKDWRQPVTQYYITAFFKLFGVSIYNLRVSSVVVTLFSAYILFILSKNLFDHTTAIISILIFVSTPVIFMHSHMGLDNIMTVPFTLLWLLGLHQYTQNKQIKFLILSAIALGISFYSYKGMRAMVPVWATLSCLYIFYLNYQPKIKFFKLIQKTFPFVLTLLPFFLVIPFIQHLYPGAIFGGARPKFDNVYDFFYPYLSHYDLTFLFIKGDDLLFHSTRIHGMYLLTTLPLFFIGLYQAIKNKNSFWKFIVLALATGPLLYGFVESVHRASRILATVPPFMLIITLGLYTILTNFKKYSVFIFTIFSVLYLYNFYDFVKYYWYTYPKFTENIFGNMSSEICYQTLQQEAKSRGLTPYIQKDIYNGFFDLIYSNRPTTLSTINNPPPANSIFLTTSDSIPGFTKLNIVLPHFNLLIKQ